MDAVLLTATASLSIYLPKWVLGYQSGTEQVSMATTIGLSLGLFSLSILEAAPSSWLLFLSRDHPSTPDDLTVVSSHWFTISRMYYFTLWALSVVILFVFPSLAGASMADSFRNMCCRKLSDSNTGGGDGEDDKRKRNFSRWKQSWKLSPWWIRFSCGLVAIVIRNMWRLTRTLCLAGVGRSPRSSAPIPNNLDLSWTRSHSNDELDLRKVESGGMEYQGPTSPTTMSKSQNQSDRLWMILGGLIGVVSVLAAVGSIGPMVVHTNDGTLLSILVSWLCAVGLLISSLLNGFGSVSMPYTCLAGLYLTPVRPEVIVKLEVELQSVREAMVKKRTELRELTLTIKTGGGVSANGTSSSSSSSSSSRWNFGKMGGEMGTRRQMLQTELEFLSNLCQDMMADIEELRYSHVLSSSARTTSGKLRSLVGMVFSIILLVRLGSAASSIWWSESLDDVARRHHDKVAHSDIITRGVVWVSGRHLVSQKDLNMLSQVVSLGLTALLTFSQTRTFFRVMSVVHRRLTRVYQHFYCGKGRDYSSSMSTGTLLGTTAPPESSGLMSTLFSQVLAGATGSYFLSCVVLMKMMLPDTFCQDFAMAMGGTDVFSIQSSIVNTVFACSAGVSLSILGMLFGIQRQNTLRHTAGGLDDHPRFRPADLV
jgi:Abscisic acid G-protein coupled receptor/The Golgi pH Regulator (GPHR) Family N-terminal